MNDIPWEQFKSGNLRQSLIESSTIPLLEEVLTEELQLAGQLELLKQKEKLNFGPDVSSEDLERTLLQVKGSVEQSLGISDSSECSISYRPSNDIELILESMGMSYFRDCKLATAVSIGSMPLLMYVGYEWDTALLTSFFSLVGLGALKASLRKNKFAEEALKISRKSGSCYNGEELAIELGNLPRVELIPTIAHEYAHHLQKQYSSMLEDRTELPIPNPTEEEFHDIMDEEFHIFSEGHARGIQRIVAKSYNESENNSAFLYGITAMTVSELANTYTWLCKKLSVSPKDEFVVHSEEGRINPSALYFENRNFHDIGNTVFRLWEHKLGDGIYKGMLQEVSV